MARTLSTRLALQRWSTDSDTQGRADFDNDNAILDDLTMVSLQDTIANRPASGTRGRIFWATDQKRAYYDTGSAWHFLGPVGELGWQEIAGTVSASSVTPVNLSSITFTLEQPRKVRVTWGALSCQGVSGGETGRITLSGAANRRVQWQNQSSGSAGEVSVDATYRVSLGAGSFTFATTVLKVAGGSRSDVLGSYLLVEDVGAA
jgi:hypothetical protein